MDKNYTTDFSIKIFFQMMHDDKLFPAVVNHLGDKEMVFRTTQKVRVGNYLKIHIPDLNGNTDTNKQMFAEVTRATRIGQMWEIGAFL